MCLQPWRGACECSDARAAHMAVGKTSGRHDALEKRGAEGKRAGATSRHEGGGESEECVCPRECLGSVSEMARTTVPI